VIKGAKVHPPEDLVVRCQRTLPYDTRAFEQLVTHYKGRVFGTAFRMLGNRQDAEDQAQEVFLKVFRNLKGLTEPVTFVSWLDRITVNTCLDLLHAQQRRPATVAIVPAEDDEAPTEYADTRTVGPEEAALRHEVQRCLQGALAQIDGASRAALVLRDVDDRPYQEIVDVLGIGLSAVKMRIHRARIAFQQSLERICPDVWHSTSV
jgi:RNA polymerase sigma-70 factor (ECF subfamily)